MSRNNMFNILKLIVTFGFFFTLLNIRPDGALPLKGKENLEFKSDTVDNEAPTTMNISTTEQRTFSIHLWHSGVPQVIMSTATLYLQ